MTRGSPGYSLLEALVAFAVMSAVLAVLIPASTRLLARSAEAEARFLAREVALSRLAALGVAEALSLGTTESGEGPWRAVLTVEEETAAAPIPAWRVTVAVDRGGPVLATVTELRPAPVDPG